MDKLNILRVHSKVAIRCKFMKACCKVNWDYGVTMSVAILLAQRDKRVNYSFSRKCKFISFHADFVAVQIFCSLKIGLFSSGL